jgi:uncharacterized membrane protein (TIGR02234 family)
VTARREYGAAVVACVVGAGLVWLALRQNWARVDFRAPAPLPAGVVRVTGQDLLSAVSALAIAALACLAAVIATRGVARRAAGVLMAALGVWIAVTVSEPVRAASVIAAAAGSGAPGGYAGSLAGGDSAIAGNSSTGSGVPVIGNATKVVLVSGPWRVAAVIGAVLVIVAGLAAAWRGTRWAVMSARFDRPGHPGQPDTTETPTGKPAGQGAADEDGDAATLWEALDRGVDLTEAGAEGPAAEAQDAPGEPVAARGDEQ